MEMEFKNQNKSNGRDNLFFDAASLVIEQQEATADLLKEKLDVNDARAEKILKELETEGIVSELLDNNTRDTLMSEEEFSLIYNYKKPIEPVVEPVAPKPKAKKQNKKEEPVQQRSGLPLWLKILLLILLFFLTFFITRRIVFFSSTRTSKKVSDVKNGWVQDGNNWNYYDINGKKVIKDTVDDGGKYYYFDDNGNLAIERWVDFNGKTFYVNKDGVMLKNQWVGEYYVGNDGNVLRDTTTPDGYKVGSDGRYIAETKQTLPQTIVIRETVPVVVHQTEVINESNVGATEQITAVDSEYGTNITAPTAGASAVIGNVSIDNEKANNYTIKSNSNYMDKSYLENGKMCSVNILIPVLVDKDGVECEGFKSGMMQEQDNIVTELFDIAESSIEEINDDDEYRTRYKYISSISFTDPRIRTQDEYSLVIRESGKCNWNNGKSSKITLTIDFDKNNNRVSYFIEE